MLKHKRKKLQIFVMKGSQILRLFTRKNPFQTDRFKHEVDLNTVMRFRVVVFAIAVMGELSLSAYGFPIDDPNAPPNVKYLIEHSDLVCRGHATEVFLSRQQTQGLSQPPELRSVLALERCYKGLLPESAIRAVFTFPGRSDVPAPISALQKNEHCLFFLVKYGTIPNEYEFISSWSGYMRVSAIVASARVDATEPLRMLEADLQAGLADSNPSSLRENLRVLAGIGTLRSTDQIRETTKHTDLQVRGTALLTLLFVHDYSQIQETLDFLALDFHSSQQAVLQNTMLQTFTTIMNPIALKTLHANVSSHSGRVRSAVVKSGIPCGFIHVPFDLEGSAEMLRRGIPGSRVVTGVQVCLKVLKRHLSGEDTSFLQSIPNPQRS